MSIKQGEEKKQNKKCGYRKIIKKVTFYTKNSPQYPHVLKCII